MKLKEYTCMLLCAAMLFSAGCQKQQKNTNKPQDEINGVLNVWTDKRNSYIFNASLLNYKKLHSNIQINVIEIDNNSLTDKFDSALLSKSGIPDILCVEDENASLFIRKYKEKLEETSGTIKKDNYSEYKLNNLTVENKVYGIPISDEPALLLYRTDLMKEAALNLDDIKTWSDYVEAGKKIAEMQGKKMLWIPKDREATYRMLINQLGGNFTSSENKMEFNTSDKIKSALLLKDLYSKGLVQNGTGESKELGNVIKQGSTASFIVSPKDFYTIYGELSDLMDKLALKKLPAFEEGGSEAASLGGESLLILKESQNKKAALSFSLFIAEDRENLKELMKNSGINPAFLGYYEEKWFSSNNWRLYSNLSKEVYPFDYNEEYFKNTALIKSGLDRIINNGEDAKIVLDEIQLKNLSIP